MTAKQMAQEVIAGLPRDATIDDIMYAIYVRAKMRGRRPGYSRGTRGSPGRGRQENAQMGQVIWSRPAFKDVGNLRDYIARDSDVQASFIARSPWSPPMGKEMTSRLNEQLT